MPTNTKNRSPMTPNFASAMRMEIEGGVVSEGGNPDVRDDDKILDTTQDSLGLGNRILVEDKNEIPSRILNSTFVLQNVPRRLLIRRRLHFDALVSY